MTRPDDILVATPLDRALEIASRGWPVFPCRADKTPLTAHGFEDATTDPGIIAAFWQKWPHAAIGIATGAAGLIVVDVDVKKNAPGLQSWKALVAELGDEIADTAACRTQSGGWHYYFKANGHHVPCSTGKLAKAVDVRGEGGYVIAYDWADGHGPSRMRELPAPLYKRLQSQTHQKASTVGSAIPEGKRDATLASLAGTMRRRGMEAAAIEAALLVENANRCRPPLPESDVHRIAESVGGYRPAAPPAASSKAAAPTSGGPAADGPSPLLVCLGDVRPMPVEHLWPRRIPMAMPSIMFGPGGLGKTHAWVDIASRVSRGSPWPDGGRAPRANVVVMSGEDDWATTLVPRLVYSGADLKRVFGFPAVAAFDEGDRRTFRLTADAATLEREILSVKAALAIVDPLTCFLDGVDTHKTGDVRVALSMLADVAARTGAAVLCILHPNKAEHDGASALNRLSGSGAFGAAARSVMAVVADPKDENGERRLLLPVKLNIGAMPCGLGFRIVSDNPDTCDSGISWDTDPVDVDADEAFGRVRPDTAEMTRAKAFLQRVLGDGSVYPSRVLEEEAAADGIGLRTLKRAKSRLGVVSRKSGFAAGGEWTCQLPVTT